MPTLLLNKLMAPLTHSSAAVLWYVQLIRSHSATKAQVVDQIPLCFKAEETRAEFRDGEFRELFFGCTTITVVAAAAGAAALGLGAWSFASSSSSPSVDSNGQKQQQISAATATAQQIYLQQEDPDPVSNCYGLIQDKVEVGERVDPEH